MSEGDDVRLVLQPKVVEPGHHRRRLLRLTGLDAQENQARRLLNDIARYRAWLERTARDAVSDAGGRRPLARRGVRADGRRACRRSCEAGAPRRSSSTSCSSTAGSSPSGRAATSG